MRPSDEQIQIAEKAIFDLNRSASDLLKTYNDFVSLRTSVENALRELQATDVLHPSEKQTVDRLIQRIERIRELINSTEIGSFSILLKNFSDAAWQNLP